MRKNKEKREAFKLFKDGSFNLKEISKILKVTPKTMTSWHKEFESKRKQEKQTEDYLKEILKEIKELRALISRKDC